MNKIQKKDLANSLYSKYDSCGWLFVIGYAGLSASSTLSIRSELRSNGAFMSIVKNRINKIALEKTKFSNVSSFLKNQVAVIYGNDPVLISKTIKKYVADGNQISAIISSDGRSLYDVVAINKLADLPSVDVLRAQLLGTLLSPASTLARLLKESSASLVRVIDAHAKHGN